MNILDRYAAKEKVNDLKISFKECQKLINDELVKLYNEGISIKALGRLTNTDSGTISNRITPYVVKRVKNGAERLKENDKTRIRNMYVEENRSLTEIARILDYTPQTISRFIIKNNLIQLPRKLVKVSSNNNLFTTNNLSCAESYILGFLTGDGHLRKDGQLSFFNTDKDIIEKLHSFFV